MQWKKESLHLVLRHICGFKLLTNNDNNNNNNNNNNSNNNGNTDGDNDGVGERSCSEYVLQENQVWGRRTCCEFERVINEQVME